MHGMLVWTLLGLSLLAWGSPSTGQTPYARETQSAQEQPSQQPSVQQTHTWQSQPEPLRHAMVTVEGGRLSVSLRNVSLRDVMAAIARQSGMTIRVLGQGGQITLTDAFVGLPLEEGLRRLLQGLNYAVVSAGTAPERQITQIFVMLDQHDQPVYSETMPASLDALIRETVSSQRIVDAVKTAVAAAGETQHGEQVLQEPVAPVLNAALQRVLGGQADKQLLMDQFRLVADRVKQLVTSKGQNQESPPQ